jgi:DNA modification methylase
VTPYGATITEVSSSAAADITADDDGSKAAGIKPHPARFPPPLPRFFVRFLTSPGDLVLDPFTGSNTTGGVCEQEAAAG